jgi:hypothetical protein
MPVRFAKICGFSHNPGDVHGFKGHKAGERAHALSPALKDYIFLVGESLEHDGFNVLAIACRLVDGEGQARLFLSGGLPFLDMDCADGALARREHLHDTGRRSQIAEDRFLSGVLRDKQERDDEHNYGHQAPERDPDRHGLEQHDLAPWPLPPGIDRLRAE